MMGAPIGGRSTGPPGHTRPAVRRRVGSPRRGRRPRPRPRSPGPGPGSAMTPSVHPQSRSPFERFARAAGAAVAVIAALALAGWWLDVEALRSAVPGGTAMNPGGTAVAFLLAGASLGVLAAPPGRRWRAVGLACAAAGVLIALVRLGGYLFDWDGGPDRWLFREQLDREAARAGHLNRMAPNTAMALVAVGLALLLLDVRTRRGPWPAQALALTAGFLALL